MNSKCLLVIPNATEGLDQQSFSFMTHKAKAGQSVLTGDTKPSTITGSLLQIEDYPRNQA